MNDFLRKHERMIRWIAMGLIVIGVFLLIRALPTADWVEWMKVWIDELGVWGYVAYGVIYIIAVLLLFPGSIISLAGGAVFGLLWGTVVISLSSTTAAALALLIGRYLARNKVERIARENRNFRAIDRAIDEGGWKIVAMLRLSPAVPFSLQNYLYGLTSIGFWECVLTSWIAMLPGTVMYVYFGYIGREAAEGGTQSALQWTFIGLGLLATVVLTVYLTRLAKKKLREQTEIEVEEESETRPAQTEEPRAVLRLYGILAVAVVVVGIAITAQFYRETIRDWIGVEPPQAADTSGGDASAP